MVFTIVVFPCQEYFLCTCDSYQRRPDDKPSTESNEDHKRFYIITPDEQCFSCSPEDPWLQALIKRCPRRDIKDLDIVTQLRDQFKKEQAKQEEPSAPPYEVKTPHPSAPPYEEQNKQEQANQIHTSTPDPYSKHDSDNTQVNHPFTPAKAEPPSNPTSKPGTSKPKKKLKVDMITT